MSDNEKNWNRDGHGQFGPGNPGGPGGSRRRPDYRKAVEDAVSAESLRLAVRQALAKALKGDMRALQIILDQTCGRPAEAPVEPQVLEISLPEPKTIEACGAVFEEVLVGISKGRMLPETGKILVETTKARLQVLLAQAKEKKQGASQAPAELPVPSDLVRIWFRHFKKTGELPEDSREAEAVVLKVIAGHDLPADGDEEGARKASLRDGFVTTERQRDAVMDKLLEEAVYGWPHIRARARQFLKSMAEGGLAVTKPWFHRLKLPEFGSAVMYLQGFPGSLAKRPFTEHLQRLMERLEALQRRIPRDPDAYRTWREKRDAAIVRFQHIGECPADELLRESVLTAGFLAALEGHASGEDVREIVDLFDLTGRATGEERERAIAKLAELARTGRFTTRYLDAS